ncbi:carboxypeptidase-like regulatory domain-containing protein [Sphingobacteriales bacterium UPWRP_1]|nr:hypothetical protein B6N25_05560 [Sphingobacteriales bacterium TSM_CSS]PSJ78358.1 carboxypeptidase-like regulatory domain-containing protein [Sphingobacteriales bacterium UPWRP_1]
MHKAFMRTTLLLLLLFVPRFLWAQTTTVFGTITDTETKEPVPFATIVFTGTGTGTTTNFDGKYTLSATNIDSKSITISHLSYKSKTISVKQGITQEVNVALKNNEAELKEVVIKGNKKVKKDTAAVALYKRVIDAKDQNSPSKYDYFSYEEYNKTEFDIYNLKEKFVKRKIFKPFRFVFDNMDTTEQKVPYLPAVIKERLSEVYYRKDPGKRKEVLKADQFSGFENANASGLVDGLIEEMDIYGGAIRIGDKAFISPFAKLAPVSYKYFLTDSAFIDNQWCKKLEFTPRRKQDLCFTGYAWIHDTTAAVKSVKLYLLEQTNLNYITDFIIEQGFEQVDGKYWFKNTEDMKVNLNVTQSRRKISMRMHRTVSRRNITVNQPIDDRILSGDPLQIQPEAYKRPPEYWDTSRHTELTRSQSRVYEMVDRIKQTKTYKALMWTANAGSTGFMRFGEVEMGKIMQMYSYNGLEGNRFRLALRNNQKKYRDKFYLEGYMAYGDKDKLLKYGGSFRLHLPRTNNKWHMMGLSYGYDWSDFNFSGSHLTHDNLVISLLRKTPQTNLFLVRQANAFYEKEWFQGFTNKFSINHKTIYSWPGSNYDISQQQPVEGTDDHFETLELSLNTQWGIGQRFFVSNFERTAIAFATPVLDVSYTFAPKGVLGSDYQYHTVGVNLSQRITTGLGRTEYRINAGKIFGKVPHPLLRVHSGNSTFLYRKYAYNLMNDLEFVNDEWVSVWLNHNFEGLFFNAVPLLRKMKLRNMVFAKAVAGRLSNANQGYLETAGGLKDLNGIYAEVGTGVENIFKMFRVYFMWRLTQRDQTDITKFAVKFYVSPSF